MKLNVLKTATAERPRTKTVSNAHCYELIFDFMVSDEGGIMIISQHKKTVKNGITYPYVVAVWLDGDYWTLRWFGSATVRMIKVPLQHYAIFNNPFANYDDIINNDGYIYVENLNSSVIQRLYNNNPGRVILCQK